MATFWNYRNEGNDLNNNGMRINYPTANWSNRIIMDVANQGLTTLPPIPDDTIELYCQGNQLTSLPELPETLRVLNCSNNQLTSLPSLPANLRYLAFENNQVSFFPKTRNTPSDSLPFHLRVLICGNNQIGYLPKRSDYSIQILSCENNQIHNIPFLWGSELEVVNFDNNPLTPEYHLIYQDYINTRNTDEDALWRFVRRIQVLHLEKDRIKQKFRGILTNKLSPNQSTKNKLKNFYKHKALFSRKAGPQNDLFTNSNIQNVLASYATGISGKTMEQQQNILAKRVPQVQRYGVTLNPKLSQYNYIKNRSKLRKLIKERKDYNLMGKQFTLGQQAAREAAQKGTKKAAKKGGKTRKMRRH